MPGTKIPHVQALLFDVFGTVVDWRSAVMAELATVLGQDIDAHALALGWRALYDPAMAPIRAGTRPYTKLDVLHRENLETLLREAHRPALDEASLQHLTRAWHRLSPWPDAVSGMTRLRDSYTLAALSNGNLALMTNLAKFGGLPWDVILGAEWAQDYKPAPRVYLGAAEALDLPPEACMMVAAHNSDLQAAHDLGLRTAFVRRPTEYGPGQTVDLEPDGPWDIVVDGMDGLADALLAPPSA